jgi:hypothetical protein
MKASIKLNDGHVIDFTPSNGGGNTVRVRLLEDDQVIGQSEEPVDEFARAMNLIAGMAK